MWAGWTRGYVDYVLPAVHAPYQVHCSKFTSSSAYICRTSVSCGINVPVYVEVSPCVLQVSVARVFHKHCGGHVIWKQEQQPHCYIAACALPCCAKHSILITPSDALRCVGHHRRCIPFTCGGSARTTATCRPGWYRKADQQRPSL